MKPMHEITIYKKQKHKYRKHNNITPKSTGKFVPKMFRIL